MKSLLDFRKSISIEEEEEIDDDKVTLRKPSFTMRPKSGTEGTLRRFDSSSSLNQFPNILRQSVRDFKSLVQHKKTPKEDSLPPTGESRKSEDVTASNLSLNTIPTKKSIFGRLRRKNDKRNRKESLSRSEFDLRNDECKENKQTPVSNSTFLQPPMAIPSIITLIQDNDTKVTKVKNDKDPSSNMPPPASNNVPISNQAMQDRRSSCYEVSNSSIDEMSSSSISCNNDNSPLNQSFKRLILSSLSRSKSDCQKKSIQNSKLVDSGRSYSSDAFPVQKGTDTASSKASDSTSEAEALHTLHEESHIPDHPHLTQAIMLMEEEEDGEIEEARLYRSFEEVYRHKDRLTNFLYFLFQQSDPCALLFYVLLDTYKQSSSKDQARWAYELYSSFVHPSAILRIPGFFDCSQLDTVMKAPIEKDQLGGIFDSVKQHCEQQCVMQLNEFKAKLSIGLGNIYGLSKNETTALLTEQFYTLSGSLSDERSMLLAAAVATFLRLMGHPVNGASFMQKDKSKKTLFKAPKKVGVFFQSQSSITKQGHQLMAHSLTHTQHCHYCTHNIGGLSPQAYLCIKCNELWHKGCINYIVEKCNEESKVDRSKPSVPVLRKKNTTKANHPRASSMVSFVEPVKNKLQRSERVSVEQSESIQSTDNTSSQHSLPSTFSLNSAVSTSDADSDNSGLVRYIYDSDFEVESEVASLEGVYGREVVKKMKKEEKKRQNVMLELLHTERTHVRNLKVMHNLLHIPLANTQPPPFVSLLFPNLSAVISLHDELNRALKERQKNSKGQGIDSISDLLEAHFTGVKQEVVKGECARFCEKQGQALDELRIRQKKDPKLASILQEAQSHPLCRRFELKDLLPTAMQRLTKYPLLISNILKHTQDPDDHKRLQAALEGSKNVLNHVNVVVRRHDNLLRLQHLQKRLDKNFDKKLYEIHPVISQYQDLKLTDHSLLMEGDMRWRINKEKICDVHVLLLEHVMLLLLKADDRLVLKMQSTQITAGKQVIRSHCPIIPLFNILIKTSAADNKEFFMVSQLNDSDPQFYDLVVVSCEEKKKWVKQIETAVEVFRKENPGLCQTQLHKPRTHRKTPSAVSTTSLPLLNPPTSNISRSFTIPSSNQPSIVTHYKDSCTESEASITDNLNNTIETNGKDASHIKFNLEDTSPEITSNMDLEKLERLDKEIKMLLLQKKSVIGLEDDEDHNANDGDIEWLLLQVEEMFKRGACANKLMLKRALDLQSKMFSLSQSLISFSLIHLLSKSDSTQPSNPPTAQSSSELSNHTPSPPNNDLITEPNDHSSTEINNHPPPESTDPPPIIEPLANHSSSPPSNIPSPLQITHEDNS